MGLLYLGSFFSLLAAFVVLWQMITLCLDQEGGSMSVAGNTLANDTRVLYGAYQVVIAGICLPFGALLFRNKSKDKENIFVPVYGVLGVIDCNVLVNSPILKLIIIDIYIPFTLVSIFFSIYLSIYLCSITMGVC